MPQNSEVQRLFTLLLETPYHDPGRHEILERYQALKEEQRSTPPKRKKEK